MLKQKQKTKKAKIFILVNIKKTNQLFKLLKSNKAL